MRNVKLYFYTITTCMFGAQERDMDIDLDAC